MDKLQKVLDYILVNAEGRVVGTGMGTAEETEETAKLTPHTLVLVDAPVALSSGEAYFYADGELVSEETAPPPETYIDRRRKAYPSIGDQLDALWKGGQAAEDMKKKVQKVKATHPKGT